TMFHLTSSSIPSRSSVSSQSSTNQAPPRLTLSNPVSLERLSQTLDVSTDVNDGSFLLKGRPAASARSLSRFHEVFAAIHAARPTAFTLPTSSVHPVLCLVALTGHTQRCFSVSIPSPQQQQVAVG